MIGLLNRDVHKQELVGILFVLFSSKCLPIEGLSDGVLVE